MLYCMDQRQCVWCHIGISRGGHSGPCNHKFQESDVERLKAIKSGFVAKSKMVSDGLELMEKTMDESQDRLFDDN